jgi:hypothetical protein
MNRSAARRQAFAAEAAAARKATAAGDKAAAYHHLERAHILGQPWAGLHSWSHWTMLKLAVRDGDAREAAGQILRLAAGGLLSLAGWLPAGNTGRARVSAIRPMPLPEDLRHLCEG